MSQFHQVPCGRAMGTTVTPGINPSLVRYVSRRDFELRQV
jgi:hypothetical protein